MRWGAAAAGGGGVGMGVEAWEGVDEAELVRGVGLVAVDEVVEGGMWMGEDGRRIGTKRGIGRER